MKECHIQKPSRRMLGWLLNQLHDHTKPAVKPIASRQLTKVTLLVLFPYNT